MTLPAVTLRALEPDDTDCIYAWENIGDSWQYGYAPAPLSRHQIWEYIHNYDANPVTAGQLRLMVTDAAGNRTGAVDLYEIDMLNRRAYVGIMIAPGFRGYGYGTAALESVTRYCRDVLGLHRLWAEVGADNAASRALFARAGYRAVARLPERCRRGDAYVDTILFSRPLSCTED